LDDAIAAWHCIQVPTLMPEEPFAQPALFPNPGDGLLQLVTPTDDIVHYCVFDVSGRMLDEGLWQTTSGLDLSALGSGVYQLDLAAVAGRSWSMRLVIEH
jgi:hypothetical protein